MNKGDPLFIAMCKQFGLIEPVCEFRFCATRQWRFDYAFPTFDAKGQDTGGIALEVEGGAWTGGRHTRGKGFKNDLEKYNRAVLLNWRVLRVQPENLRTMATIEMIRELLRK